LNVNVSDVIVAELDQAFEEIFREHYHLAYCTAYGVTGNSEDAEDVVQGVFLRMLRRGYPPELKKNPKAYLYRAVVNESLNSIRSKKRFVLTDDAEQFEAQPSGTAASESVEEIHRRLYEAVAELKPDAAHILILRYVHKYSDAEIAKLLGTTRGTIAVSLYRSRSRLKKLMRGSSQEKRCK
jgi:RNA polymerase sigma-70 factor (ECF subfamily)